MFRKISLFFLMLFSSLTFAQEEYTGAQLLEDCTSATNLKNTKIKPSCESYVKAMACYSYILGIDDMHNLFSLIASDFSHESKKVQQYMLYCLPKSFTLGQGIRIIDQYLKENPKDLHKPANVLIIKIFSKEFPCENGNEAAPALKKPLPNENQS